MGDVRPIRPAPVVPIGTRYHGGGTRSLTEHERADQTRYATALDDMLDAAATALQCDCVDQRAVLQVIDAVNRMLSDVAKWEDARC